MRRLRRLLLATGGLIAIAAFGIKFWLGSAAAATFVAGRVSDAAGTPVTIGQIDVGWSSSQAKRIDVGDWLTLAQANVGLSIPQLVRGDTAGDVLLNDVAATLTFDADDRLVTPLPKPKATSGPVPCLRLDGGSLTLAFPGRKETFRNLRAVLRDEAGRATLTGTADDPDWGPWQFTGAETADGFQLTLTTRTAVHVTPALLRRVPFVKPTVWDVVTAEGDTPVEVALHFAPQRKVRYRVSLEPKNTHVFVSTIDLNADAATGRVVIEEGVVTLENVRGKSAGGELTVGSTMDFRGDASVMKFVVGADDLAMALLPDRWRLLRRQGKLSGSADLTVTSRHGQVTTSGDGRGELRILPLLPPIKIRMRADGRGYAFDLGL